MVKLILITYFLLCSVSSWGETMDKEPTTDAKIKETPKMDKATEAAIEKELEVAAPAATNKEERKDLFNLTSYDPIYFIYAHKNSKVQASFKYRVLRNHNLYIGYTHLLIWDIDTKSDPIRDINYNPELFYRTSLVSKTIESIDYIPWGHKSNGREFDESRSFDYAAVQFNFREDLKQRLVAKASLRARFLYNFDPTNKDLRDYLGPWEARLSLTQFSKGILDKAELTFRVFTGGDWGQDLTKGGQELGLSFRVKGVELTPAFYIQYYHGYSETLRYYNREENAIRFGVLL